MAVGGLDGGARVAEVGVGWRVRGQGVRVWVFYLRSLKTRLDVECCLFKWGLGHGFYAGCWVLW